MISAGCNPCRAAISSSGGAQAYGRNPSGSALAVTADLRENEQVTQCYKLRSARNHAVWRASNTVLQAGSGALRSRSDRHGLGMEGQVLEGCEGLDGLARRGQAGRGGAHELHRL